MRITVYQDGYTRAVINSDGSIEVSSLGATIALNTETIDKLIAERERLLIHSPPTLTRAALVTALCKCSDNTPQNISIDTDEPVRELDVMRAKAYLDRLRQIVEGGHSIDRDSG